MAAESERTGQEEGDGEFECRGDKSRSNAPGGTNLQTRKLTLSESMNSLTTMVGRRDRGARLEGRTVAEGRYKRLKSLVSRSKAGAGCWESRAGGSRGPRGLSCRRLAIWRRGAAKLKIQERDEIESQSWCRGSGKLDSTPLPFSTRPGRVQRA